jgi:hypothetical protein
MRQLLFLLFLVPLALASLWLVLPATWELHVLAGQSNAMGYMGKGRHYPPETDVDDGNIPFFYVSPGTGSSEGRWTHLSPQTGRTSRGYFGPEVTFARALRKSGSHPAIFKYTIPSTSLANDWKLPGQGGQYDQMLKSLREAITLFEKDYGKVEISSFTWIQGESDAETDEMAGSYEKNLSTVISHFRSWCSVSDLPVIIGMDEQHPWVKDRPIVVEGQRSIVSQTPNTAFLSMQGLQKWDTSHLTSAGLIDHGLRWFEVYSGLPPAKKTR